MQRSRKGSEIESTVVEFGIKKERSLNRQLERGYLKRNKK